MSSISLFGNISVVVLQPKFFLCIPAFAAGILMENNYYNGLITFFINGNPVFINDQEILLIISS